MITSIEITDFISSLNSYRSEGMFNPWADTDRNLDIVDDGWINRQMNLHDHLKCDPKYILIGEAPGYQGCRYTGIPFTSERLIYEGRIPRLQYAVGTRITTRKLPWSEPSATIVWKALTDLGMQNETILWNAYPFHPHRINNPMSNRTPSCREFEDGNKFTESILCMYPDAKVIAVGNNASEQIWKSFGINAAKIRHPANGGASKFRLQLSEEVSADMSD